LDPTVDFGDWAKIVCDRAAKYTAVIAAFTFIAGILHYFCRPAAEMRDQRNPLRVIAADLAAQAGLPARIGLI
jgi:hypothetical protein